MIWGAFSRPLEYSRDRGPRTHLEELGLDSCADDRSLLFYKGRYYVMLSANEPDPLHDEDAGPFGFNRHFGSISST